ncbi:hypothetical protein ACFFLS_06250 [Flavobacterium procerum]|uniref:Uncharacterized protein n=1 Tax=Flavobacterium procerum TaxID=1455569 RepID=A0ABV6BMG0_9FLAO
MEDIEIIAEVENDITIPRSRKFSTNLSNVFVYNIEGEIDDATRQSITNTIEAHGGRNGFRAIVTFNVVL